MEIEETLLHERTPDPITAVVIIERASLKYNDVKQEWSATIRFRHIEPLDGDDVRACRALLEKAYATRTGEETLPIELDGIDPEPAVERDVDLDTPLVDGEGFEPDLPRIGQSGRS